MVSLTVILNLLAALSFVTLTIRSAREWVILFSTKCFLFVYIYIDLLKLKANTFENSDADLSWLLFLKKPTCLVLAFSSTCFNTILLSREGF